MTTPTDRVRAALESAREWLLRDYPEAQGPWILPDHLVREIARINVTLSELDGMVLVPAKPTREMLNAAVDVDTFRLGDISPLGFRISPQRLFEKCYAAMVAPYIKDEFRADLVSTPNKPAEVDLDALKRRVEQEIKSLFNPTDTHEQDRLLGAMFAIDCLAESGHIATGKGGDVQAALDWLYEKATAGCTEFTDQLPDNYNTVFMALKQPSAPAQIDAGELAELQTALDFISENGIEMSNEGIPHIRTAIKAARAHLENSKGGV